jgi:hydroxymethylbilane synthase
MIPVGALFTSWLHPRNVRPPGGIMSSSAVRLRLGTRASPLARWQAEWVAARLRELGVEVQMVHVTTSGDRRQDPIGPGPDRGLFTKEIQRELLEGRIDLAVHSLKDLPTDAVAGLGLAAVPQRAEVCDVLVSDRAGSFAGLAREAIVGTGSLRRRAQLLHARSDLRMRDLRGNVDTRIRKLHQGDYDAIVLAEAGLRRLGLAHEITQVLPLELALPAVGQGALGIEARSDDAQTRRALAPLDHAASRAAVTAERAMLAALQGGCLVPIAAWARLDQGALVLTGRVLSTDGAGKIEATLSAAAGEAISLGSQVADSLLAQGAAALIDAARGGHCS